MGMNPQFQSALDAMFADALAQLGGEFSVFSGYRSVEHQQRLWEDALQRYGSPEEARMWVAPPGNSGHNHGIAADLRWNGQPIENAPQNVVDWLHGNAANYGMHFPMDWEPWHIEYGTSRDDPIRNWTPGDPVPPGLAAPVLASAGATAGLTSPATEQPQGLLGQLADAFTQARENNPMMFSQAMQQPEPKLLQRPQVAPYQFTRRDTTAPYLSLFESMRHA